MIKFRPENTAIDTRNSKSAVMIAEQSTPATKVLDYGCGTGRNMRYISEKTGLVVDGTEIPEQLEKEVAKHDQLRAKGCMIGPAEKINNGAYDLALNSHVLNVIESDQEKVLVVADIFQKLKQGGKAIIEVRTKSDVESSKTKVPHGPGWKVKKGKDFTYQEAISKEKMVSLVSSVGFKIEEHICNSSSHIIKVAK